MAKVIFLHLSVILFTGGGCLLRGGVSAPGGGVDVCSRLGGGGGGVSASGWGVSAPGGLNFFLIFFAYGQQAAGTHPTGMHSC